MTGFAIFMFIAGCSVAFKSWGAMLACWAVSAFLIAVRLEAGPADYAHPSPRRRYHYPCRQGPPYKSFEQLLAEIEENHGVD